jgi:iron complex outermembrane receptor protein
MMRRTLRRVGLVALAATALPLLSEDLPAQQPGTLTGRVTDAETGQAVAQAQIQLLGGPTATGALSGNDGRYTIQLAPGTYDLVVEVVGYRGRRFDGIQVLEGRTTTYDITLPSQAQELDGLIVSASRGTPEKSTEAPATTYTVSSVEIAEKPTTQPADYLRSAPGVDIITQGIQASNVVVRGFNNIFSGSLHMLTDYRLAGVPSLRVNLMHFIPTTDQDIERMEVVLGPGSALYGPNTANGVVHMLTKSPLDDQGTTVSFAGGERDVLQGSFRSAFLLGEDLGVKVSGQYLQGQEWPFVDSTEAANRAFADQNPALCIADKQIRGLDAAEADRACERIGIRDYDTERYSVEARADWRFAENGTFVATYGRNSSTGIELTGLGAGQTEDWVYEFWQARMSLGRFFAQAYLNTSDAGGSYLLNSGVPLVDQSRLIVGQLQHGFDAADGVLDFTYGIDWFGTRPRTNGQINGTYEDEDEVDEVGVYLQSRWAVTDRLELVGAARVDNHSILEDNVFSPRAAIVYRPGEDQSVRLSYNRAYSAPSTLNYFLDISNGFAPGLASLGFGLRAYGTGPDGWSLQNPDGSLKGFRSPFNPAGAGQMLPMQAATGLWPAAIGVLQAQVDAGALPAELGAILPLLAGLEPTGADLGTMLLNPAEGTLVPLEAAVLPPVLSVQQSNTETMELGWTGILDQRLKITADIYFTRQNDFVSPLLVQTPLVTLNGQDVAGFITGPIVSAITQQLIAAGLDPATAQAQAQEQAAGIVPQLAEGIATVPLGVVSSPEISGGSDVVVTYRNVGDLDLWGSDLALQWFLDDEWTLNGTYSYISDDLFEIEDGAPIALNAPQHKGTLGLSYRNLRQGFNAEARVRFRSSFPAISAGFEGEVPGAELLDLTLGYSVPGTPATVQLAVNNVFDTPYQSFVGVPDIGRFALLRVKYDLF